MRDVHRAAPYARHLARDARRVTPEGPSRTGFPPQPTLRRHFGAEAYSLDVNAAGTRPPARKRRRSGDFIRNPVREGPSGVEMAPELGFRPHLLLECALRRENGAGAAIIAGFSLRSGFRRQNLAGRRVTDGIPFEKRLPASKWRRRGGFVRRRCKTLPSGATSTNT